MHGYAGGHYGSSQVAPTRSPSLSNGSYVATPGPINARVSDGPFLVQVSKAVTGTTDKAADLLPRDISSRFGLRLRELRRSRNMTQLRMAVDFGIDRSFISDVERGRKSISLHMLEVIALGMKVTLSDLLDGI